PHGTPHPPLLPPGPPGARPAAAGPRDPAPPSTPNPPAPAPAPPPPDPATALRPPAAPAIPDVTGPDIPKYEIKGRRDPFETLDVKDGVVASSLGAAKLTGIERSSSATLALVEKIGRAHV